MVKIYDTDTIEIISRKIYFDFEVLQSCTVSGFVMDMEKQKITPKGELVMQELSMLYNDECCKDTGGRKYRKFAYRENSVGGPIAHKIFTFDKKIVNNEPRYTIWRFQ